MVSLDLIGFDAYVVDANYDVVRIKSGTSTYVGRRLKWGVTNSGYECVSLKQDGRRKTLGRHQVVFIVTHGYLPDEIDHIDGDKTNNSPSNLRACSSTQNKRNTVGRRTYRGQATLSQFKGVSCDVRDGRWTAVIRVNGRNKSLGRFDTEVAAAKAYDDAAREHFGDFAYLNFES